MSTEYLSFASRASFRFWTALIGVIDSSSIIRFLRLVVTIFKFGNSAVTGLPLGCCWKREDWSWDVLKMLFCLKLLLKLVAVWWENWKMLEFFIITIEPSLPIGAAPSLKASSWTSILLGLEKRRTSNVCGLCSRSSEDKSSSMSSPSTSWSESFRHSLIASYLRASSYRLTSMFHL